MAPTATGTVSTMLELRMYLMLMAILAATGIYLAGLLNPPGGDVLLRTEDLTGGEVLVLRGRRRFNAFNYRTAATFMASVVFILLLLHMERRIGRRNKLLVITALRVVMVVDFFAVLVAYAAGVSRGTVTTVPADLLFSAVSICTTGYAAYHALFRPSQPDQSPGDAFPERRRKILMLFSIFASTVAYTAGLSRPGGFRPDRREGYRPGSVVLQDRHHSWRLIAFFVCNTVAFVASLRGIMLLTTIKSKIKHGDGNGRWWYVFYGHVVLALSGLFVAYAFGGCRETHSSVYLSGLVFPVLAYTTIKFIGLVFSVFAYTAIKFIGLVFSVLAYTAIKFIALVFIVLACIAIKFISQRYLYTAIKFIIQRYLPTAIKFIIQRYLWDMLVDLAEKIKRRLSFYWTSLKLWLCSCWSSWTDPDEQNVGQEHKRGAETPERPEEDNHGTDTPEVNRQEEDNHGTGKHEVNRPSSAVLLIITLAATMTYQGVMNPPGGVDPILLTTHAKRYKVVFAFKSLALVISIAIIRVAPTRHASILDLLSLVVAYAVGCGRDVNTSVRVIALGGGILVCVVIHIVFFALKSTRETPELLKKKRKLLLLFAILIVTITYQAVLTPPGSFWLEDGYAVLAKTYPHRYEVFFSCNAASFMSSVAIIILLVNPHMYELGIMCHALCLCAGSALFGLIGASYVAGSSRRVRASIYVVTQLAGVLVFIVLLLRAVKFLSRCTIFRRGRNERPQTQEGRGYEDRRPQEKAAPPPPQPQARPRRQECGGNESDDTDTAKYTTCKYLLLVGIMVASVTYQASLIPPGGVWPHSVDGPPPA